MVFWTNPSGTAYGTEEKKKKIISLPIFLIMAVAERFIKLI